MKITPPYYPIIYLRGFAATMSEIEDTVATPYMGFNLGATKIRQNHEGKIIPFIFESPLIRLMKDEGYRDTYEQGEVVAGNGRVAPRTVWIFRYYERVSEDLGEGERLEIPEFAEDLRRFILNVRDQVCGQDADERKKFKVYLVAHSMGGLICRCYLQNICSNGVTNPARNQELELPGDPLVDKVFTYATPHNGIDIQGMNVPNLGSLDRLQVRNFNRDVMRKYLALPPESQRVDSLNGVFPPDRFFCFVGTNYNDYTAFFGLSRKGTGSMSDGLVMIRNATVHNAPRAFAYRSHSGHYGIVNSEEGYQNLRRFLFGQIRVDVKLRVDRITLPRPIQKLKDDGKKIRASYYIESGARVRGANYYLHERRVDQSSAILRGYDQLVKEQKSVYLFTGYLYKQAKTAESKDNALAFAIRVGVQVPLYEVDNRFWFDDHFEGGYVLDETITLKGRVAQGEAIVSYGLASTDGLGAATKRLSRTDLPNRGVRVEIPLGFAEGLRNPPMPGFRGRLILEATPWNA